MFTEPEIVASQNSATRSYVAFYYNGKRYREYNGNRLGKPIHPNRAKSISERDKALQRLRIELLIALENGSFSDQPRKTKPVIETARELTTLEILKQALVKKQNSKLTKKYSYSLETTCNKFIAFLTEDELEKPIDNITTARIEEYLHLFNTSNTHYMSKRTEMNVLFNMASKLLNRPLNAAKNTERRRLKATLHIPFEPERVKQLLAYLKETHSNLYLCCLLTYGTFLRPHKEIRLLTVGHFKKEFSEIQLAGTENKSGRVRIVYIAEYIREELVPRFKGLESDINIFTLTRFPHNQYYFNTAWKRIWTSAPFKLKKNETIYSFRHTAAVHVYRKTKDIHIVQQLIGHSDMIVTLKYLRGLGELNLTEQKQYMPTL